MYTTIWPMANVFILRSKEMSFSNVIVSSILKKILTALAGSMLDY